MIKQFLTRDTAFRRKGLITGIDSPQKAMTKGIAFHRKGMIGDIAFRRKAMVGDIGFRRKAMASTINIIVTVVVIFGVGLLLYMVASGIITDWGQSSKDKQKGDLVTMTCASSCDRCCLTGWENQEYYSNCAPKPTSDCDICTCP